MNEIISCTPLGVASFTLFDLQGNPSGREVWTGVRVRMANGKKRFFTGMTVEAEAALILRAAMEHDETVELWLSGKEERVYPYGVRTATDEWYGDAMAPHLRGMGIKFLVMSILCLPFLGIGLLMLPASIGYFITASTFSARHSRTVFDLGYEAGVLGRRDRADPVERRKAA